MPKNQPRVSVALVTFLFAIPVSSHAEIGTVETLLSGIRNASSVDMGVTTVIVAGASGTLTFTKSSGAPFFEGESATVQCASLAKKSAVNFELEAYCTATFSPEDRIFLVFNRKTGDLAAGTSGEGSEQIIGGTGKFAGIAGQCQYKIENFPGNWSVTISKCRWYR